jgi:GNAT superfamily N-acetyltransferase
MAELQIRFVSHRDIGEVTALLEAQLREHQMTPPTDVLRQSLRTVIDNPHYGFILLAASADDVAVGVAYASSLLSFEHGGVSGWVEELYVTPAWRGQGIGSRLLEILESWNLAFKFPSDSWPQTGDTTLRESPLAWKAGRDLPGHKTAQSS